MDGIIVLCWLGIIDGQDEGTIVEIVDGYCDGINDGS